MPRIASKPATLLLLAMTSAVPLVLLNTAAAQHKPHQQKHVEREQIEHLEDAFQKAQLGDDVAAMDRLLSEDYLGINANGEVFTKTQQLDHMRNRSLVITQLEPRSRLSRRWCRRMESWMESHCAADTGIRASISGCRAEYGRSPTLR
jgi:hypothetical protein